MSQKLPIRLRMATEEDVPFVFNSWLKSYRRSLFGRNISNPIYFTEHHKIIEKLATTNQVIIACNNTDPSQVYGYICAGKIDGIFVTHYVYVKQSFRNLGIARILVDAFGLDLETASLYTHHTRPMEKLATRYNCIYHPYLIFNEDYYKDLAKKQTEAAQSSQDKIEQEEQIKKESSDKAEVTSSNLTENNETKNDDKQ